jgi:AcrR family transcriptional regulator
MARQPDPHARERILEAATRLFDRHGVHAVGLQQIIDELGCGKNLLYREFANKDQLVVAYLQRCRQGWASIVERAERSRPDDPAAQLVAVVRLAVEEATKPGYRGCPVSNTRAEFASPDHPVNDVAIDHFETMRGHLYDLATRAGAADPRTLADRIKLIIDGLNVNGATQGGNGAAAAAVAFAEEVVRSALRPLSDSALTR